MPRTSPTDREAFWRKLVARHESSHRSVAEVCELAGVSTASFYAWRRRFNGLNPEEPRASLVPVRIVPDLGMARPALVDGGHHGQITIELEAAVVHWPRIRVCVPTECEEAAIRRVLQAILGASERGAS